MVDRVAQTSPKLVEELVPKIVSIGDIQRVLRQLLRERVPVRDLTTILEAIADAATATKDPDLMVEAVRAALGRAICRVHQSDKGELPAISFAPALEERSPGVGGPDGARDRAGDRPVRSPGIGHSHRPGNRNGRGTARAFVLAGPAPAPVAVVLAGAATSRGALAQRGAIPRQGESDRRSRLSAMHLKRFRGTSVQEALAAAREELGPTALVLSTRMVPAQGLKGWFGERVVEVTAATDRPGVEKSTSRACRRSRPTGRVEAARRAGGSPSPAGGRPESHVASRLAAMGLSKVFSD